MKMSMLWYGVAILVAIAFVLNAIGGYLDMIGQEKIGFFSKTHAWQDALFVLGLAILSVLLLLLQRG